MNIIVRPYGSDLCYCRPDTTWEREDKDFYVPDSIDTVYWVPVVFARISKAGKCIGGKFVSRYYDGYSFGVLLYCNDGPLAFTSCADHTSRLPLPFREAALIEDGGEYRVIMDGEEIFSGKAERSLIEDTICRASGMTSLRIGDFVAVEMDSVKVLAAKEKGQTGLEGRFNDETAFSFKLIF